MAQDYYQGAAIKGIPQNANIELLTGDATKTLVTVRNASYTLYIQRITYVPTTVAAQAITVKDSAGTPVLVALIPASQATPYVADFGVEGIPLTEAKNLTCANTAGPGGRFKIECYAKLTTAGVNINSGASLQ
jgi:hypothetical protein